MYSNGTEDVITSPYNNVLATRQLLEHATCVFPAENRSLLDISLRKEKHSLTNQKLVNYSVTDSLNGSVVDMLMHLTRFVKMTFEEGINCFLNTLYMFNPVGA